MGSEWKPRDVTTNEVGRTDVSPVDTARLVLGSRVVCARDSWAKGEEEVGGANPVGERKKSRDQVLGVVPGLLSDPLRRSWRARVCCRVSLTSNACSPTPAQRIRQESRHHSQDLV